MRKYCGLIGKEVDQFYVGRVIGSKPGKDGYIHVHIGVGGKKHNIQVGRLVLMAFHGMPDDGEECCHGDGDPSNNRIENLRWDSHYKNNQDRVAHGTYSTGEDHHAAKAKEDIIRRVKSGEISPSEAAKITGLRYAIFWRAKKGETWNHIKEERK